MPVADVTGFMLALDVGRSVREVGLGTNDQLVKRCYLDKVDRRMSVVDLVHDDKSKVL